MDPFCKVLPKVITLCSNRLRYSHFARHIHNCDILKHVEGCKVIFRDMISQLREKVTRLFY